MVKFLSIVLILFFILAIPVIAITNKPVSTTADLYKLYKIKNLPSAEDEINALKDISETFSLMASKVIGYDMLETATDAYKLQYQTLLASYDKNIYELESELEIAGQLVNNAGNESVNEILKRDSQYRTLLSELNSKLDDRSKLVDQLSVTYNDDAGVETDRQKLSAVKEEIKRKEDNLKSAVTYSELGQVGRNKFPLNSKTRITSAFGWRLDPLNKESMQLHKGLDLSAELSTEVVAQFNGVVEKTYNTELGGNTLIINHGNGVRTVYAHLNSFLVKEGDIVKQYQKVALSGNTGSRTTGHHLHFGIYIGNQAMDPALLFK